MQSGCRRSTWPTHDTESPKCLSTYRTIYGTSYMHAPNATTPFTCCHGAEIGHPSLSVGVTKAIDSPHETVRQKFQSLTISAF